VQLERFIVYTCNAAPMDSNDPIANTVAMMLSSPICITLSEVGVRAFKPNTVATIPYYLLDAHQTAFVRRLTSMMLRGLNCTFSSGSDGGFVMRVPVPHPQVFIDKTAVSNCLAGAIFNASGYGGPEVKKTVLSILFQRITALASMPQPQMLK